ncbi:MAG TPA: HDOD domain-containing protein, partial [Candidatus Ozemobacteraceae bacterium]|nr:HDOD domain-containing protein [Candidatus Ozemobacteraceae bacterium]
MTEAHPFQARDRGEGILEVIGIFPGMTPAHPTIVALTSLARKFRHILFTLEPGASLDTTVLPKLLEVSSLTDLRIVTSDPTALPYAKAGLSVFSTPEDAIRSIRGDASIKQIKSKMDAVPQLHSQAFEMLQKLNQPETSFADLETMISNDPGLSAQILKSANSAFFMRRNKVETLSAAMAYLGTEGLKQLLMYNVFKGLSSLAGAQKEV